MSTMPALTSPAHTASASSTASNSAASSNDDSAMGAFAHLVALLKDSASTAGDDLPPLRDASRRWIEADAGPDALWASVWFPAPETTPLPLPFVGTQAAGSVAALHASVGETQGDTLLTPALLGEGRGPTAGTFDGDGATLPVDANGPRPDSLPPTASDVAVATLATAPGAATPPRTEAAIPVAPVPVDVSRPDAPLRLAEQVVWALGEKISEVRLQLHPQDLGAIDVKLFVEGEKVRVEFESGDATVRDVVQTSLPSLSSLLSARGLQLDHAQVFAPKTSAAMFSSQTSQSASSTIVNSGPAPLVRRMRRAGLLDDYV